MTELTLPQTPTAPRPQLGWGACWNREKLQCALVADPASITPFNVSS